MRGTAKKTKAGPGQYRPARVRELKPQQRPENIHSELKEISGGIVGAEIERRARDARVMADLRAQLDEIVKRPGAVTLTQDNAMALLGAISEGLKPATDRSCGQLDTGKTVFVDHPAISLLDELIDALSDLKYGLTHDALQAASHGANARLPTAQRKLDAVWFQSFMILQIQGLTRASAMRVFASAARKRGLSRRGKWVTEASLKSLFKNYKTRKH